MFITGYTYLYGQFRYIHVSKMGGEILLFRSFAAARPVEKQTEFHASSSLEKKKSSDLGLDRTPTSLGENTFGDGIPPIVFIRVK